LATEHFLLMHASMEQATDGAETAAIDGLVSLWSENISVSFCLRAPAYGLTLWCALGLLVGGTIQMPQLQLQLTFGLIRPGYAVRKCLYRWFYTWSYTVFTNVPLWRRRC